MAECIKLDQVDHIELDLGETRYITGAGIEDVLVDGESVVDIDNVAKITTMTALDVTDKTGRTIEYTDDTGMTVTTTGVATYQTDKSKNVTTKFNIPISAGENISMEIAEDGNSVVITGEVPKIDVDVEMSNTSENPVQNKVIKEYIDNKEIILDTEMSDTSTNAVQNKVIKEYVDNALPTMTILWEDE